MLVNINCVLWYTEGRQCYIDAFDMPNLEILMAVTRTAEKRKEPVIIQHAQLHECGMSIHIISPIVVRMTKEARVPVCIMLDRGKDLDYVRKTLDLGFFTIVYGDSFLTYGENVAMAREVAAMVKACNADVKAEIGIVAEREGKTSVINDVSNACIDPELAARYVKDMGMDALAASAGTTHGFYAAKPKLDFDRIVKIKELTGLPLVMHGGSGISVADIQRAIRCGTRKISYFSYISNAGTETAKKLLEGKEIRYFHDLTDAVVDAMK